MHVARLFIDHDFVSVVSAIVLATSYNSPSPYVVRSTILKKHVQGWHPLVPTLRVTTNHKIKKRSRGRNELLLPVLASAGELLVACSYGGGLCYLHVW